MCSAPISPGATNRIYRGLTASRAIACAAITLPTLEQQIATRAITAGADRIAEYRGQGSCRNNGASIVRLMAAQFCHRGLADPWSAAALGFARARTIVDGPHHSGWHAVARSFTARTRSWRQLLYRGVG